jgi:pimeloyl-ACP methyl ester carboxylesterase
LDRWITFAGGETLSQIHPACCFDLGFSSPSAPGKQLEVVEGIGQRPHLEAPERFNELVLRFMNEAE